MATNLEGWGSTVLERRVLQEAREDQIREQVPRDPERATCSPTSPQGSMQEPLISQ